MAMAMDGDEQPRPNCNCRTSHCIRRYCNCFSDRWYCSDGCRCEGCWNTEAREAFVEESAEMILKSKPGAFQSKIASDGGPSSSGKEQRRHVKGCTCRKSECKKNYCECFKNRVACTARCQCEGCANSHGPRGDPTLLHNNGDSGGTSGDSNGTSDGGNGSGLDSNGTSTETAVITDEDLHSPTEAGGKESVAAFGEPLDIGPHVQPLSGSGLDGMCFSLPDTQDYFRYNVHPQMHQGSARAEPHDNAICMLQCPSNPGSCDINNGS